MSSPTSGLPDGARRERAPLRQAGLIPIHLAAAYPPEAVRAMLRAGRWARVRPGAYVETPALESVGGDRSGQAEGNLGAADRADADHRGRDFDTETLRALAQALAFAAQSARRGRTPVFVRGTAALLHGLPTWRPPTAVHVSRGASSGTGRSPGIRVHTAPLTLAETCTVHGRIRASTVTRTALDIARFGSILEGLVVLDGALRSGVTREQLCAALVTKGSGRGVRQARELIDLADPGAESPWESRTRLHVHALGLPRPVAQHPIATASGQYRADLAWPRWKVLLEFDGMVKYTRLAGGDPAGVVVREKLREDALRSEGWTVVRVTAADLTVPAAFHARLLRAFPPQAHALAPRPHLLLPPTQASRRSPGSRP